MPNKPIAVLYCGSGFIRSLFDKLWYHFGLTPIQLPSDYPASKIKQLDPAGLIVSGSGSYVNDIRAEQVDPAIYELGLPLLGVCYGMQRMAQDLGGEVKKMKQAEREDVTLTFTEEGKHSVLHADFADDAAIVWMSHNCRVTKVPDGFVTTGSTELTSIASMEDTARRFYGVQYHPEHTGRDMAAQAGTIILHNFLYNVCGVLKKPLP